MADNHEIARALQKIAEYLAIQETSFKPRAYERAAESIEALDREATDVYKEKGIKGLEEIAGVGAHIAKRIESFIKTGAIPYLEQLKKKMPVQIDELSAIEGLGPRTIKLLYQKLHIKTIADLEKAARAGTIRRLPRLGEKTEEKILKGISFLHKSAGRMLLGSVLPIARSIEERLRRVPGVSHVAVAGSIRRMQETAGDIDVLATAAHPEQVMNAFMRMDEVAHVYSRGPAKTMVRLKIGIDADLRVVPERSYGAALQYFTGNKAHNIAVRTIAAKKGYTLSEYGLFKGKKLIASRTEEEIYAKLGMQMMPPELRTASGEIEAARAHKVPHLIPYGSLKGDLQAQTDWTDGSASIERMAHAAHSAGLEYIAITDHTKALAMTGGLDEKKLARQGKEIDAVNKKMRRSGTTFRVLKGAEVNILKDGTLDIADAALKQLDIVGISVHSHFNMSERDMTARIIRAMKNPYAHILFHPTGRLINKREPYAVDILQIVKAAREFGIALEANASPERLDLKDAHIRLAVKHGVPLTVDSDAHAAAHFNFLDFGIAQVRRGWGTARDVLNTLPADQMLDRLRALKKEKESRSRSGASN